MIKKLSPVLFAAAALCAFSAIAPAQETQTKVVDEVVAVVNDGVITLSRVKRESKSIVDTYVAEGKTREEAQRMVDEKQGELIANLINEELLVQRAKELGIDKDVDQQVNQRMADIMKQNNIKTVEQLNAEMEKQGLDPRDVRENWRKQATRDLVIQREVQAKIYYAATGKELKDYFDAHKDRFSKPESVSFSELFLGFAGRDENAVRDKASQIYQQLKGGADFAKLAKENGDRGVVTDGEGSAQNVPVLGLEKMPKIGAALKGVPVGGYTAPIELEQMGMTILKVDAREAASNDAVFDDNAVRMAIVGEKSAEAQKTFLSKLRQDSYIKIGDSYRPIVAPILYDDERKTTPAK